MAAFELTTVVRHEDVPLPSRSLLLASLWPRRPRPRRSAWTPVYIEDRLNQLQQSITMLTGQLEQLQYRNQQLQQQMEKMQADYEYRLEQIEKGGGGGRGRCAAAAAQRAGCSPAASAAAVAAAAPAARRRRPAVQRRLQEAAGRRLRRRGAGLQDVRAEQSASIRWRATRSTGWARPITRGATTRTRMTAFAEGYKVYKASPKGPDNLLKLGVTLAVLGRKPDACAVFATLQSGLSARHRPAEAAGRAGAPEERLRVSAAATQPLDAGAFARLMAPFEPFETHPVLAVAVSGGRDSLALALLAHDWAAERGGRVRRR